MIRYPVFLASALVAVVLVGSCGSDDTGPVDSPRTITNEFLPDAVAGTAYSQPLAADCPAGVTPEWSVAEGALPPGLALESSTVAGMPTTVGHYEFTISVSCQGAGERDFVMEVLAPPTLTIIIPYEDGKLPDGRVTQPYHAELIVSGGAEGTAHLRISEGTLPAGISIQDAGNLGGTPTGPPGVTSFTIEATQGALTATLATSMRIRPPQLAISPGNGAQLPDATAAALSTVMFQATGGSEPYHWGVQTTMPTSWLEINGATGELTFIPVTAGDYDIIVVVSDDFDATSVTVHVKVVAPGSDLHFSTGFNILRGGDFVTSDGSSTSGMTIIVAGTAEGGVPPYQWSTISDVPGGLTVINDPMAERAYGTAPVGDYQAVFTVTDAAGHRQSMPIHLGVVTQFVQGSIPTPFPVQLGSPLLHVIPLSGGRPGYFCHVIGGSLPPGLTVTLLNGQQVIVGTATASGSFFAMVECMDGSNVYDKYPVETWQHVFFEYAFEVAG